MAGTGARNDRGLAFLAPGAPRVMIGADMSRIAKIDVGALRLGHCLDLRVFRLQPFVDQRLIPLDRPVQRLLRGNAKLRQQAAHRVPGQTNAILSPRSARPPSPGSIVRTEI